MPKPEAGRAPSRPGLPAPYTNPWQLLRRDLAAVIAATGLKLRELWRLNGEGELPRPRFWPGPLTAAFWPLLLALALILLLGFVGGLPGLLAKHAPANPDHGEVAGAEGPIAAGKPEGTAVALQGTEAEGPGAADKPNREEKPFAEEKPIGVEQPSGVRKAKGMQPPDGGERPDGVENPDRGQRPRAAPATQLAPEQAGTSATESAVESAPESGPESGPEAAAAGAAAAAEEAAAAQRLLADLVGQQPPDWILALEERPAEGLLRLRLGAAFSALPPSERRKLAERWLERGRALGYESLELLDASSRLLARQARVGSGMILLESGQPSP